MPNQQLETTRTQELAWIAAYSYYAERLCYRYYTRLDKLISFLLLLSGMAVVGELLPPVVLGLAVAVLTAWQLVYAPSVQAGKSRQAMQGYGDLLNRFSVLSEHEINQHIAALSTGDSPVPRYFEHLAHNAACKKLGVPQSVLPLNRREKLAAWFCG